MRKYALIIGALIAFTPSALAADYVRPYVPNMDVVGEGRLSYLFWDVYDATLRAPGGELKEGQPFALSLSYLRDIDGEDIADRSAKEIRNIGFDDEVKIATWYEQMRAIFPDVSEGDTLTGIFTKNGKSVFYFNGQKVGKIDDREFSKAFFDIWLSRETSAPSLRAKLLSQL